MPTFCRHNRFIDRCPICSKTLPGNSPAERVTPRRAASHKAASGARPGARGGTALRVRRQERAVEDGYASSLVPGLRASADAERLAAEIAFSNARLLQLDALGVEQAPTAQRLYGYVKSLLASGDVEQATWITFLIAYLCPLEGAEPFAGVIQALQAPREQLADLGGVALGPRTSHDPARGSRTLDAYRQWAAQAGSQQLAFSGDASWTPQRRFERLFERFALPGLKRAARYELLMLLGALSAYELQADSLRFSAARSGDAEDPATLAAKRVFAIGDAMLLDRRAGALADALAVPVGSLALGLANWATGERATLGFPQLAADGQTLERAREALGL